MRAIISMGVPHTSITILLAKTFSNHLKHILRSLNTFLSFFKSISSIKMEGQQGFNPHNKSKNDPFHQEGFQQTGFQPTDAPTAPSFSQGGFNSTNIGFQPPPDQQKVTITSEKLSEIESAVKSAQDALDKLNNLISDIAFTPQKSTAFD